MRTEQTHPHQDGAGPIPRADWCALIEGGGEAACFQLDWLEDRCGKTAWDETATRPRRLTRKDREDTPK